MLTRTHCDNCDAVMNGTPVSRRLSTVLKNGDTVDVDTIVIQPVTGRRIELCRPCVDELIASARPRPV